MITNPFARKPKSPLDQALDVIDNVRSDAAVTAAQIRDAAAKAADVLGEATPDVGVSRKLPVLGVLAAAGLGVAIAIKARGGKTSEPALPHTPTEAPKPAPAVATAAKTKAEPALKPTPTEAPKSTSAAATAAKSTTAAPPAAEAGNSEPDPATEVEPEKPSEPKAATAESDATKN